MFLPKVLRKIKKQLKRKVHYNATISFRPAQVATERLSEQPPHHKVTIAPTDRRHLMHEVDEQMHHFFGPDYKTYPATFTHLDNAVQVEYAHLVLGRAVPRIKLGTGVHVTIEVFRASTQPPGVPELQKRKAIRL